MTPCRSSVCNALRVAARRRARTQGETAVDHGRGEVDDGGGRDHGLGECGRRILDPGLERLAEVDPVVRRIPERFRIDAAFAQQLFEHEDRGDLQELRRLAVLSGDRQRTDGPGRAGAAGKESGIDDDAAADEGANIEVNEIRIAGSDAEGEFRATGAGSVILEENGMRSACGDCRLQVEMAPPVHLVARCADLLGPVPEFEGRRYADAGDALALLRVKLPHELVDTLDDERDEIFGQRIGVDLVQM